MRNQLNIQTQLEQYMRLFREETVSREFLVQTIFDFIDERTIDEIFATCPTEFLNDAIDLVKGLPADDDNQGWSRRIYIFGGTHLGEPPTQEDYRNAERARALLVRQRIGRSNSES